MTMSNPLSSTPAADRGREPPPLVLASGSRYRAELLRRLGVVFSIDPADVDETRGDGETPDALAERLANDKARAVAARHPDAVIIGSDQVAALGDRVFGKPGTADAARAQLAECSGRALRFVTSVCVITPDGEHRLHNDVTTVTFRTLDAAAIARYVASEQPLDCAGSFKSEAGGIALIRDLRTDDPTALIGLPLIALAELLRDAGFTLP